MSEWDNTLFFYIIGDNGAAPAGGIDGVFNEMVALNGLQEDVELVLSKMDEFGGPKAGSEYPVGFAWAMCTPFQFTKQFAGHFGGTRNPMIVTWPERITNGGGLRSQFHHVVDIAPTILEAAGIPAPVVVNGVVQKRLDGISLAYTFGDSAAEDRRRTQYFEIQGTRGICHESWIACTYHGKIIRSPRTSIRLGTQPWKAFWSPPPSCGLVRRDQ